MNSSKQAIASQAPLTWLHKVVTPCDPTRVSFLAFFFFFANHMGCRILILQPGIEPRPPAVKAWCPNHWTAREFSILSLSNTEEGMISFLSRVEFTPVKHRVARDFPDC